jgi:predicted TPR repeat methyltransferase
MAERDYLKEVYDLDTVDATRRFYDDWSESYDSEIARQGYATPARCAAALAEFATDKTAPTLDFGCGTGLSGMALAGAGFTTIDGVDLSPEMLERAKGRGVYRALALADPEAGAPFAPGAYAHVAAIGVIGSGAAPAETIDAILGALGPGGLFVFSFNDHTLDDPVFEGRVMEYVDCGAAELLFREHGDHLPGIGLSATVYVLRKR